MKETYYCSGTALCLPNESHLTNPFARKKKEKFDTQLSPLKPSICVPLKDTAECFNKNDSLAASYLKMYPTRQT